MLSEDQHQEAMQGTQIAGFQLDPPAPQPGLTPAPAYRHPLNSASPGVCAEDGGFGGCLGWEKGGKGTALTQPLGSLASRDCAWSGWGR